MLLPLLRRACGDIQPADAPIALRSFAALACLLASYFVLLPVREEAGLSVGVRWLPSLFAASLLATLITTPLASAYLAKGSSSTLQRFYIAQALALIVFLVVYESAAVHQVLAAPPKARAPGAGPPGGPATRTAGDPLQLKLLKAFFYVAVNVQNLVNVSALWARCADAFSPDAAARTFGFISAGATVGQLAGSITSAVMAGRGGKQRGGSAAGIYLLMLPAAVLMLAAAWLAPAGRSSHPADARGSTSDVGGGRGAVPPAAPRAEGRRSSWSQLTEGFRLIGSSPYLLAICGHLLLNYVVGSLMYFEKSLVVAVQVGSAHQRTRFFALVNSYSAALILALQLAATPRMLRFLGMRAALSLQPGVCLAGLALIARHPSPAVVAAAEVVRKVTGYAISRPARELLFTVVSREEKYKGKLVVDTVVQRAGDTLAAGAFQVIENTWHAGPQGVAVAGCTVCLGWLAVVSALGRRFTALSAAVAAGAAAASQ